MDFEKFTQKSIQAVQAAQNMAMESGNPQIEDIHLNKALLEDKDGLIPKVLRYMGVSVEMILKDVDDEISKLPKQQGGSTYSSKEIGRASCRERV